MDFLAHFSACNMDHIIERICHFAGYAAIVNMHIVCKDWNQILKDLNIFERLLVRRLGRDPHFRKLCHYNCWLDAMEDIKKKKNSNEVNKVNMHAIYSTTDLKERITG